jgi:hypothetical protein
MILATLVVVANRLNDVDRDVIRMNDQLVQMRLGK